jgi:hypothetical protein
MAFRFPLEREIAIRQRSVCETTRDNTAATRDDQAMQEQVTMHLHLLADVLAKTRASRGYRVTGRQRKAVSRSGG